MRYALLVVLAACYSPKLDFDNGVLACSASSECPTGYHCASNDTCWKDGQDPAVVVDAGPASADGGPPDAALVELVVTIAGDGIGTVTAGGLTCVGTECRGFYSAGTQVTLHAAPTNETNSYFPGWDGDCRGAEGYDCTLTMSQDRATTAFFSLQVHNITFVSSVEVAATLGGRAAYDAKCNELADAAGINNAANDGFVAWMSVTGTDGGAHHHVGTTRVGFVRTDGQPVANNLATSTMFYPPMLDELRRPASLVNPFVWSATSPDGLAVAAPGTCANWATSMPTTDRTTRGYVGGGPGIWTLADAESDCSQTNRIRCVGVTKSTEVVVPPPPPDPLARYVFVSAPVSITGLVGGRNGLDTLCNAQADTNATLAARGTDFRALVPTMTSPASDRLNPAAIYFRLDGSFVGFGTSMAMGLVFTGIWQDKDGVYLTSPDPIWTGSTLPNIVAGQDGSCGDWSTTVGNAIVGMAQDVGNPWNRSSLSCGTTDPARVYCVEQ